MWASGVCSLLPVTGLRAPGALRAPPLLPSACAVHLLTTYLLVSSPNAARWCDTLLIAKLYGILISINLMLFLFGSPGLGPQTTPTLHLPQGASRSWGQQTFSIIICAVQMLSQLNSTMGLPKPTFICLLLQNLECPSCLCCFSVEGYHEHRKLELCSNTPDFHFIPELYPELEGIALPNHTDKINTIVGRAWIAWNSCQGVPKDIWALISTAFTHCCHCDLIHTFVGDYVHRDENHICLDVGQGIASTIANGVGGKSFADGAVVVWKMN
ncbi:hypothetical protein B0H10DRAFT_1948714 [Mycena sp. CBHHK59/15]|nr:hypothetical protein B0H10DRAFT_1948714 [Mycena sp. CBHHK59/15]